MAAHIFSLLTTLVSIGSVLRHLKNCNLHLYSAESLGGYTHLTYGSIAIGSDNVSEKVNNPDRPFYERFIATREGVTCMCSGHYFEHFHQANDTASSTHTLESIVDGFLDTYLAENKQNVSSRPNRRWKNMFHKHENYVRYSANQQHPMHHFTREFAYTCTLVDTLHNRILLVSDAVASSPLWYAFPASKIDEEGEVSGLKHSTLPGFVVTNDLLAANLLGFTHLTPLGPGHILAMDTMTNELVGFTQWHVDYLPLEAEFHPQSSSVPYAYRLFGAALKTLKDSLTSHISSHKVSSTANNGINNKDSTTIIILEKDPTDASSKLLLCAAEALEIKRKIIVRTTLVSDADIPKSELFHTIMSNVSDLMDLQTSSARYPNYMRIAAERWNFCEAAKTIATTNLTPDVGKFKIVIYSYDTGMDPRPFEVFFQNLFCSIHGVEIIYPMRSLELQRVMIATSFPKSFLYRSIDILNDVGICNVSTYSPKVYHHNFDVENSSSHTHDDSIYEQKDTTKCKNTSCADSTESRTKFDEVSLNHSSSMASYLTSLWEVADKYADISKRIVVVVATSGYKDMLANFLCSATSRHVDVKHILIVTPDNDIATMARDANVSAFIARKTRNNYTASDSDINDDSDKISFGSLSYQELMLLRTRIVLELQLLGFRPIVADIDVVWNHDPLAVLTLEHTYKGGFDVAVTDDNGEICGCFVALNNSEESIFFWQQVYIEHQSIVQHAWNNKGILSSFSDSEQKVLTRLLLEGGYQSKRGSLIVRLLSEVFFPSGFAYFNLHSYIGFRGGKRNVSTEGKIDIRNQELPSELIEGDSDFHGDAKVSKIMKFTDTPIIVHNNFVVGKGVKKTRFERYLMWNVKRINGMDAMQSDVRDSLHEKENSKYIGDFLCGCDGMETWRRVFVTATKDILIPTLSIVTLPHNSIVYKLKGEKSASILIQVTTEGLPPQESNGILFLENDPLSSIDFKTMGMYDLFVSNNVTNSPITAILSGTNVAAHVDLSIDTGSFSLHYNGIDNALIAAHDYVLSVKRNNVQQYLPFTVHSEDDLDGYITTITTSAKLASLPPNISTPLLDGSDARVDQGSGNRILEGEVDPVATNDNLKIKSTEVHRNETTKRTAFTPHVHIKVIAYNRPKSLLRLLNSLLNADYLGNNNISLHIFVDAAADSSTSIDKDLVFQSREVANNFQWPYGEKTMTFRDFNVGLASQWYDAWIPVTDEEVAFIFEDDVEVSPLFYVWSHRAMVEYFTNDVSQREKHLHLLQAVRNHIEWLDERLNENRTNSGSDSPSSILSSPHLDEFVLKYAGHPLLYGICLQKQHLDTFHYPQKLEIRNFHRPYLYSLIGSWGFLAFPAPWTAFREWWAWRFQHLQLEKGDIESSPYHPYTGKIITNFFYKENPHIWTPWFTRFAYETSFKCLYPNLPYNFTLASNHRESGVSYSKSLGTNTEILTRKHLEGVQENGNLLLQSFMSLPSMSTLTEWQYDFHVRRVGSLGDDTPFVQHSFYKYLHDTPNVTTTAEMSLAISELTRASMWQKNVVSHGHEKCPQSCTYLQDYHIYYILQMLEANVPPWSSFVHIEPTSLFPLSLNRFWRQMVITSSQDVCKSILELGSGRNKIINSTNFATETATSQELPPGLSCALYNSLSINDVLGEVTNSGDYNVAILHLTPFGASAHEAWGGTDSPARNFRLALNPKIDYILVISDSCSSGPSDISVIHTSMKNITVGGPIMTTDYTLIEDICLESVDNIGGSLFKKSSLVDSHWHENRMSTSRRIESHNTHGSNTIFAHRRFTTKEEARLYV